MTHIASSILVVGILLMAHVVWDDLKPRLPRLLAPKRAGRSARVLPSPPR